MGVGDSQRNSMSKWVENYMVFGMKCNKPQQFRLYGLFRHTHTLTWYIERYPTSHTWFGALHKNFSAVKHHIKEIPIY